MIELLRIVVGRIITQIIVVVLIMCSETLLSTPAPTAFVSQSQGPELCARNSIFALKKTKLKVVVVSQKS